MIKERYCSFEVAKLLKEKGFNEDCRDSYDWGGNFHLNTSANNGSIKKIAAPTQSMVMDWLREVHNIDICAFPYQYDYITCGYEVVIYKNKETYLTINGFKIYKESCEAAIKYCLENLI